MLRGSVPQDLAHTHVGQLVAGRYRLVSLIGLGGMGAVYEATDHEGQPFALKLLYPELLDGEAGQRFERESKVVLGLSHPHVVATIEAGFDDTLGSHFLVMPRLHGRDLDSILEELGALVPEAAVRIALHAARGLSAAHRLGIVHRDVKPGNLLFDHDGDEIVVKVCDFGIAKRPGAFADDSLTSTGSQLGTPDYAAPEQLKNAKAVDARSDIWGLGATLYQMLCGVAPFSHIESVFDLITAICTEDVPHLQDRAPWVEPKLARHVHRALSRDPNQRFATMEAFADALRPFSAGDEYLDDAFIAKVPAELRAYDAERADLALSVTAAIPLVPAHDDKLALVGKSLDQRYRVLRLIGRGGMGSVDDVSLPNGKKLAAKVISAGMTGASANVLERFAREARAASDINSPNVVATLDTGSDGSLGMPFIIMELLHGTELSLVLKQQGALAHRVAVRLMLQGASGVAAAHTRGVVHRDIKPANLFLQIDEESHEVTVKVCDFGVAKRTRLGEGNAAISHLSLTRTGGMVGSPMYMSPEQAKNAKAVDERTDVWSLAVVLWEALSGLRLWGGQTSLGELIVAVCTEPIPQLEQLAPWVPRELAQVVHRGLERDPERRHASVQAFIEALTPFADGSLSVKDSELVGLTEAERAAVNVVVDMSAAATTGMLNLQRGGRGGASLPPTPESRRRDATAKTVRPERPRAPAKKSQASNIGLIALLLVVVGVLAAALGYLLTKS